MDVTNNLGFQHRPDLVHVMRGWEFSVNVNLIMLVIKPLDVLLIQPLNMLVIETLNMLINEPLSRWWDTSSIL